MIFNDILTTMETGVLGQPLNELTAGQLLLIFITAAFTWYMVKNGSGVV